MIANVLVLVFILALAFWFSTEGLFSAILHLIVTILAGAIAFGVWETLVYSQLLGRMYEMAWGVGLLAPFVLALLLMRIAVDKFVPGQLNFPSWVDQVGGGAVGFLSGVLTAGVLVIGLNFIAPFGLGSFERWQLDATGDLVPKDALWIPADDIAGSFFTMLSGGSMGPAFDDTTLPALHPDLARSSGAFRITSRDGTRATMVPQNIEIARAFEVTQLAKLPSDAGLIRPTGDERLIVITTRHNLEGVPDFKPDVDPDSVFTVTRAQVALIVADDNGNATALLPVGYVFRGDFGTFENGQFARTRANPVEDSFDWIFHVPQDVDPTFIRMKQVRVLLPELDLSDGGVNWATQIQWKTTPPPTANGNDPPDHTQDTGTPGAGTKAFSVKISNELPTVLSKNWISGDLGNLPYEDNALVRAEGTVTMRSTHGVEKNLRVDSVHHASNSEMVRVAVQYQNAESLFGKAREMAQQLEPPRLLATSGDDYPPSGYCIANDNRIILSFTGRRIRTMREIDTAQMESGDTLYLYFLVNKGDRLTDFRISGKTHAINLTIRR